MEKSSLYIVNAKNPTVGIPVIMTIMSITRSHGKSPYLFGSSSMYFGLVKMLS